MELRRSAALDRVFAPADPVDVHRAIKQGLAGFQGELRPEWIGYLARRVPAIQLEPMQRQLREAVSIAAIPTPAAAALSDFLGFQAVAFGPVHAFQRDPECPPDIESLYKWAASRLHAYGRRQSQMLGGVAARICRWCKDQGVATVDIVESPLGGTIPAEVIARCLNSHDVDARIHEFLTPRLDRHGRKHSIKAAAKAFFNTLRPGHHPVIFPDEVVSGTRFNKLHKALRTHLGERLVPVGLFVTDFTRPGGVDHDYLDELRKELGGLRFAREGVPTHTMFSPAQQIKIDHGPPIVASSPFFWSELDTCAGRRKVNLVFGVIAQFRGFAEELKRRDSLALSNVIEIERYDSHSSRYASRETIVRLFSSYLPLVDWKIVESRAREIFRDEYTGIRPNVDDAAAFAYDRTNWVLQCIYELLLPHSSSPAPDNEAQFIVDSLNILFALRGPYSRTVMPRDRDFCEYTIPYAQPLRSLHDELLRLVESDVPSLDRLPSRG